MMAGRVLKLSESEQSAVACDAMKMQHEFGEEKDHQGSEASRGEFMKEREDLFEVIALDGSL